MLKSIYISNYALITSLEIEFEDELTVLTGETGAGKSIILGALSLILGNRADNKSIKIADKKCIVEAVFDISNYKQLHAFFDANALDNDGKTCIVRRELSPNGKSRAFINDTPVSLHMLRELCNCLIDIHSQHENLLLSNTLYQLDVLDTVSQNTEDLVAYRKFYYDWKTKEKLCNELIESAAKASE